MSWHSLPPCLPVDPPPPNPALDLIRHSWPQLAGIRLAGDTFPRSLDRRGALTLKACGLEAGNSLRSEKSELLKRLQAFAGVDVVREIRWETVAARSPDPDPPAPALISPEVKGLGEKISDPGLKSSFMAACRRILERPSPSRK